MQRRLWVIWRWLTVGFLGTVIVLWFIDKTYSVSLLKSLVNGEIFVNFLAKNGTPRSLAIIIAFASGTYDEVFWFLSLGWLRTIYTKNERRSTFLWRIGKIFYRILFTQPTAAPPDFEIFAVRDYHRFYQPLVMYGFLPGGMLSGVSYALTFDLSMSRAFWYLAAGNLIKMAFVGLIGLAINPWIVAAIVIVSTVFRKNIEVFLKAMLSPKACFSALDEE